MPESSSDTTLRIRVLNPQRQPLGGTVDIEFKPQGTGQTLNVKGADASKDIDVSGLQRTPQGLYQVTVTPTDVFRPSPQFVNVPASGFTTLEFIIDKGTATQPGTTGGGNDAICLRIRVLNPQRQPLGGTVDIELKPQNVGDTVNVKNADASKDIDVKGLQRTPQGLYQVTVTPTDVFKPNSQFVTIPASGFVTVEFVIDKGGQGGNGGGSSKGTVQGKVVDQDGIPLANTRVSLFAKYLRTEQKLGDATTDNRGQYTITYSRPAALNLVMRAYDASGKVIAESNTVFAAPPTVEIDFTSGPGGVVTTPSIFTTLGTLVAAQLQGTPLEDLKENKDTHELRFLTNAIDADFQDVAYLFIARVLGEQNKLRDETLFGIFHEGIPASLDTTLVNLPDAGIDSAFMSQVLSSVLTHSRASLGQTLTSAVNSNTVPKSYANSQNSELSQLDALRVQSVQTTPYIRGKTPLNDLLTAGSVTASVHTAFVQAYADNGRQLGPTWKALRANPNLSASDLATLKITLQAGELLVGNIILVKDTIQRISQKNLKGVQDLALLDQGDWVSRITALDPQATSIPAVIPNETPQQRIARLAMALAIGFAGRYPTTAFLGGLTKAGDSTFTAKAEIVSFLSTNPQFSFKRTNIDQYIATNKIVVKPETLGQLKVAQRLFRISPQYASVDALNRAGYRSAQSVYFKGRAPFVAQMSKPLGSEKIAQTAYAKAQMSYATSLMAFGRYNLSLQGIGVAVMQSPVPNSDTIASLPGLQFLFGSLDCFQCDDCQSVYSPAAYLVDLLQYLTQFNASGGEVTNARDALFLRRPDIQYIALNCNNTNLTLPYIDVVNEILESAVAPPTTQVTFINTTGSSAERRALPQQISQSAYATTAATIFPLSLPFDLPFTQTTAYVGALGTTWSEILSVLSFAPTVAGAGDVAIACAALSINPEMQQVIANPDATDPWTRWGLVQSPTAVIDPKTDEQYTPTPADWVATLQKVPVLLNRSGLSLQQLYQLLEVVWVTNSVVNLQLGTTTVGGVQILSPDTDAMVFTGLTGDVLDRGNRFLRLWSTTQLQMWELDWALEHPTGALPNLDRFFVFLSGVVAVGARLKIPFQELLSFWLPLETRDVTNHLGTEDAVVPSTYSEVFRNPTVLATWASVFPPLRAKIITAASNTSPIAITTSYPHGFSTGTQVAISGVVGNTAANGKFTITVISYTQFSLNGSTGNGNWTSGGVAQASLSGNPILSASSTAAPSVEQNAIAASLALSADDISAILTFVGAANALSLDTLNVLLRYQRLASAFSFGISDLILWIQLTASTPFGTEIPVTSASNASPIAIAAANPHGLQSGAQVTIGGVLGNTAANGTFTITVTGAITFTLNGSTGNGNYTAGGVISVNGPAGTLEFLRRLAVLQGTKISPRDLDYLLRGQSASQSSLAFTLTQATAVLQAIRDAIAKLPTPAKISISSASNTSPIAIGTKTPHGLQTGAQVSISGVLGNTAANGTFTITVTDPRTFTLNGSNGNGAWTSGGMVVPSYDPATIQAIFLTALATATGVSSNVIGPVLLKTAVLPLTPATIGLLLGQASVDPTQFPTLINAIISVAKAAAFFAALKPTEAEFEFIVQNAGVFGWLDPSTLPVSSTAQSPYPQFEALLRALKLNRRQTARTPKLFDVLGQWLANLPPDLATAIVGNQITNASNTSPIAISMATPYGLQTGMQVFITGVVGNTAANGTFTVTVTGTTTFTLDGSTGNGVWTSGGTVLAVIKSIALALNGNVADVMALATALKAAPPTVTPAALAGSLTDMAMLAAIADAIDVIARYGMSGATLVQLSQVPATPTTAATARSVLQSQYSQNAWFAAIQPVEDILRQKRRDAVLAYLMGSWASSPATIGKPVPSTDEISNHYLLDPQMTPCMLTTRLLEASLAIQQFVQQCFLDLPSPVTIDLSNQPLVDEWSWRQQYRLWQANREVFLYPENYLLPELRKNASPFFLDLENELRQSDCDADASEVAIENYLRKLVSVSRLVVAAHYQQTNSDGSTVLYVFGHTEGTPPSWYYRTRTTANVGASGMWSPWEPLNLDIASSHLVPVIWDRRLHLVWPIFKQISEKQSDQPIPAAGGGSSSAPQKFWAVEFATSELSAGKWQPKRTITEKMFFDTLDSPLAFTFQVVQDSIFNLEISVFFAAVEDAVQAAFRPLTLMVDLYKVMDAVFASLGQTPPSFTTYVQDTGSGFSASATVNGQFHNDSNGPYYSVTVSSSGTPAQIGGCVLTMPESPLSVYEIQTILPNWKLVDLGQEPTFALVKVSGFGGQLGTPAQYGYSGQDLVYGNYTYSNPGQQPLNVLCTMASNGQPVSLPLLGTIVNPRMVVPQWNGTFDSGDPFFIEDRGSTGGRHIYLVLPYHTTISSSPRPVSTSSSAIQWSTSYVFQTFYHPYARTFLRELEIGGIRQLMSRNLQLNPQTVRGWSSTFDFVALYNPQQSVAQPYPGAPGAPDPGETALDFDPACGAAYSLYNWETFYHLPMFVASLLMQNQKYQDSMTWLAYIFNPTDSSGGTAPQKFWQMAPFYQMNSIAWISQEIQNLLTTLAADTQLGISDPATANAINNWMADPFDPHAVASLRIAAYAKATVMKFLDNLIAWGDSLFSQYTAESVNQAEQLYIIADMILGPKPDLLRPPSTNANDTATYAALQNIDLFSNTLVEIENIIVAPEPPDSVVQGTAQTPTLPMFPGIGSTLLFCIPPNNQLLAYWDKVAQRLYNIRHCKNLQGVSQPLALYAPPLNPLLLAEGQAAGAGSLGALPLPPIYRFATYLQKAVEITNDVRSFGALILAGLEKQDSETLAVLRANQEADIQTRMLDVKQAQVTEAQDQISALQNQKAVVQIRYNFYSNVAFLNAWEIAALALQGGALIANGAAVILDITSGVANMVPNFQVGVSGFGGTPTVTMTYGGESVGRAATSWASVARGLAGILSEGGGLAATMGGYQRRMDEWQLQAQLASAELTQLDSQITTATDRFNIANSELAIQNVQISNAQDISNFLTSKYTNAQLYNWMASQLTTVYAQAYQLAFALALQAQNAYQYELGNQETFIQYGYWDSPHIGLTAGESLLFDLRRMEAQYLAENSRELELTKHVSLALTNPLALVSLRETGTCTIALDESLFDQDHPGQYFRRLRAVALTIPCVTGPYTGVNATLGLTNAAIRTQPPSAPYVPQKAATALPVISAPGTAMIATSSGQNDAGLFEVSLRDERWLPFEGQGAISQWTLTLDPRDNNFDLSTITDVILHVRYTARGGADQDAANAVRTAIQPQNGSILASVKNTFSDAYYKFFNPTDTSATQQTLTLPITPTVFPFSNLGTGGPGIKDMALFVFLAEPIVDNLVTTIGPTSGTPVPSTLTFAPATETTTIGDPASYLTASAGSAAIGKTPQSLALVVPSANIPPSLAISVGGQTRLDPAKIEDIVLIIEYVYPSS
jgi:hypothetical protein